MVNSLLVLAVKLVLFLGEVCRFQDDLVKGIVGIGKCEYGGHALLLWLVKTHSGCFYLETHLELLPVRSRLHFINVCGMDSLEKVGVRSFGLAKRR